MIIRKVLPASVTQIGDDEVEVVVSTAARARDGHIFESKGARVENYRKNPVVLWSHDPEKPVGTTTELTVEPDKIRARMKFTPLGLDAESDRVRNLVKSGVVQTVSVGMDPIEAEPIEAGNPKRGMRVKDWELLEWSFVSIPVDTGAVVTARGLDADSVRVEPDRDLVPAPDLPLATADAMALSIFDYAGGKDFDPAKARRGFLAYDSSKPKDRRGYLYPIARAVGGELRLDRQALSTIDPNLLAVALPAAAAEEAGKVLSHYRTKLAANRETRLTRARGLMVVGDHRGIALRGFYQIADLAQCLNQLGYIHNDAEWEKEIEQDDSAVPAMIGEALKLLGATLVAMSTEEVGEFLAKHFPDDLDVEIEARGLAEATRAHIGAAKTKRGKLWRLGLARAGRTISAATKKALEDAAGHMGRAMKHHKAMGEDHEAVAGMVAGMREMTTECREQHAAVGESLKAAKDNPAEAADHVDRALKAHGKASGKLDELDEAAATTADRHEDTGDGHRAMGRSMTSCDRCVRGVVDGAAAAAADSDGDSTVIQTTTGIAEDKGSRGLALTKRQADARKLALSPA